MGVTGSWCPRSLVGRVQSRQRPPWLDEVISQMQPQITVPEKKKKLHSLKLSLLEIH